jgi:hypothetical protein
MQEPKMWLVFLTALIPLFIGIIWYSKFAFGAAWQREAKLGNQRSTILKMTLTFLLLYVLGILLSFLLMFNVIHQMHLGSLMADPINAKLLEDKSSKPYQDLSNFVNTYGKEFRSFKHGALHGFMTMLIACSTIISTLCLFEKKSFRYFLIHTLYWCLCGLLMGGILSAYA